MPEDRLQRARGVYQGMAMKPSIETRVIKKGTIVHVGGFPVRITSDATVESHPANWPLIDSVLTEQQLGVASQPMQ